MSNVHQPDLPFRVTIVAPTYDNARTLRGVLDGLAGTGLPTVVVDDGCTDDSNATLFAWSAEDPRRRHLVTHPRNRGKAQAMQTGFDVARKLGFTHALTFDTDGQHDARDVQPIVDVARAHPRAMVIGTRSRDISGYPTGSLVGRWVSNTLVRWESGAVADDTQCGLRVYPLNELATVPSYSDRFGYETEIVTRFAWAGGQIAQAPIRCVYDVAGGRTSHFRPWLDSFKATAMHMRLLARSMTPWPVPKTMPNASDYGTVAERLARWFNPVRTWRQLRSDPSARQSLPRALAAGIVVAALPLYGLKTVICLPLAKVLRSSPWVVIASSSLFNTPPVGPFVALAAIVTGHYVLHGSAPTTSSYDLSAPHFWRTFGQIGVEWVVGGLVVGATLGAIGYAIVKLFVGRASVNAPTSDDESMTTAVGAAS
jgi:uncharacterized protein (DUF2062 family)